MTRTPKVVLLAVLFTAFLLEGAVLYLVDPPTVRLGVGLGLFLVIGWMLTTSEVAEVISDLPRGAERRRNPKLRAQVNLILSEVRRLHGMALDGDRGFRNKQEAVAEMDAIESRLRDLVGEIRREVGAASDEPDPGPAPDEPSESEV